MLIRECPYCGELKPLTSEDHVIPKCLFDEPFPGDIPKIMVCEACNTNKKSMDDSHLRDVLVIHPLTQSHPIAKEKYKNFESAIVPKQLKNGRVLNQSALPKYAQTGLMKQVYLRGPNGIQEPFYVLQTPPRMKRILSRIVRGLYPSYIGVAQIREAKTRVQEVVDLEQVTPTMLRLADDGLGHVKVVGTGDVFSCFYAFDPNNKQHSFWILIFYNTLVYSVICSD